MLAWHCCTLFILRWINGLENAAVLTLVEEHIRFASAEMKNNCLQTHYFFSPLVRLVRVPHNDVVVNTVGMGFVTGAGV